VPYYFDSSALTKLVVVEAETESLREWMTVTHIDRVASILAKAELLRAVNRNSPDRAAQALIVISSMYFLGVTRSIIDLAGALGPVSLRTFDAIHLATAMELGSELDGIVTYDRRLADAAHTHGLQVVVPA